MRGLGFTVCNEGQSRHTSSALHWDRLLANSPVPNCKLDVCKLANGEDESLLLLSVLLVVLRFLCHLLLQESGGAVGVL